MKYIIGSLLNFMFGLGLTAIITFIAKDASLWYLIVGMALFFPGLYYIIDTAIDDRKEEIKNEILKEIERQK